jgi:hypothetical protein
MVLIFSLVSLAPPPMSSTGNRWVLLCHRKVRRDPLCAIFCYSPSLLDAGTPGENPQLEGVPENEIAGSDTDDEDACMSEASNETEKPKAAGALCINGRPACWYSPDLFCSFLPCYRGPPRTGGNDSAFLRG